MKSGFQNAFADFLAERLGAVLFALRESNPEYRSLCDEYDALLNGQYQSVDEYKLAIAELTDIQLLRALLIRERAGGNAKQIADFVKRCLLM